MKELLRKYCSLELKDLQEKQGIVSFYFSTFGIEDSEHDETTPTAFDKTFSENKARIKHFRNHDTHEVPGTITELGKDSTGAYAVSQLALKTIVGRDTFEQYQAGVITEHSFGYVTIKADKKSNGGRILKELKLMEVSSLTHWGSNEYTPVISVKSIQECAEQMEKINIMLTKGNISDSLGEKFTAEYKKLEEFMKKNAILSAMGKVHCDNCNNILPDKEDGMGYVKCPSCQRFANSSTGKTVTLPLFSKSLVENFSLSK